MISGSVINIRILLGPDRLQPLANLTHHFCSKSLGLIRTNPGPVSRKILELLKKYVPGNKLTDMVGKKLQIMLRDYGTKLDSG